MNRRLDKLEDGFHKISINQAEQTVILKEISDWVKIERSNSGRITVLENNWKWAKGILVLLVMPLIWLIVKQFL